MNTKGARSLRKKAGSYHHGNLREALLEAAVRRIEKSREFEFRLRDLADDCGVRLAACYRHFPAKKDVLVALAERGFVALQEALDRAAEEFVASCHAARGSGLLEALGVRYVLFARDAPVLYLAMFHPALSERAAHPGLLVSARRTLSILGRAVQIALPEEASREVTEDTIFAAWSVVHGYASLLVSRNPAPDSTMLARAQSDARIAAYLRAVTPGLLACAT